MIVGRIANWRQHLPENPWAKAFDFLSKLGPDSPDGETLIDGKDILARVMSYETKTHDQAVLESHRHYIDIQMTLSGSEGIEWIPAEGLRVKDPYDDAKDVTFYHAGGAAPARVDVHPGTFVVLYPEDAHMPQLIVGPEPKRIKKVVIKLSRSLAP